MVPGTVEVNEQTRVALSAGITQAPLVPEACLFPITLHGSLHLSTRQYARIVSPWICGSGLDIAACGTQTTR